MLSVQEQEYLIGLVNAYKAKGYKYYLCHTISYNSDYDFVVYFSKEKITAVSDSYFSVNNSVRVYVNSSTRSQYDNSSRDTSSSFTGNFSVDLGEFIYTNADTSYTSTSTPINPDIMSDYDLTRFEFLVVFLICFIGLYIFICHLFGIGGR